MLPDLTLRADLRELMDSSDVPEAELTEALAFLETVNRRLGGYSIFFSKLRRWTQKGSAATILDAGTGGADLPLALERWGRQHGVSLKVTGLDADAAVIRLARRRAPHLELIQDSISALAATGRTFDFVISSLTLHHVPEPALPRVLRDLDRMARRGLVVGDLRRSALGWAGVTALTALFGNRVTRHDGPVSFRRALTVPEAAELVRRTGLPHLAAAAEPMFRLSVSGRKDG